MSEKESESSKPTPQPTPQPAPPDKSNSAGRPEPIRNPVAIGKSAGDNTPQKESK